LLIPFYMGYMRLVLWTSRVEYYGMDRFQEARRQHEGLLVALWHENVFFVAYLFRELHLSTLASESDFGTLITGLLKRCNGFIFRGGSGKKKRPRKSGILLEMIKHMLAYRYPVFGITVDGSRGPAHVLKPGVVALARSTGAPLMTIHVASRPRIRVRTWDRTRIPLPFGRIFVYTEGPLFFPEEAHGSSDAFESFRKEVEDHLKETYRLTEHYLDSGERPVPLPDRSPPGYGEAQWRSGKTILRSEEERLTPLLREKPLDRCRSDHSS
jgi:hypothetical protein